MSGWFEPYGTQRGHSEQSGVRLTVPWDVLGHDRPEIADSRSAVPFGVGVQDLVPSSGVRQAEAVVVVRPAAEVDDARQRLTPAVRARGPEAKERECIAGCVVGVDPGEPCGDAVQLPQRGMCAVDVVEIFDQRVDSVVRRLVQQPPVQAA